MRMMSAERPLQPSRSSADAAGGAVFCRCLVLIFVEPRSVLQAWASARRPVRSAQLGVAHSGHLAVARLWRRWGIVRDRRVAVTCRCRSRLEAALVSCTCVSSAGFPVQYCARLDVPAARILRLLSSRLGLLDPYWGWCCDVAFGWHKILLFRNYFRQLRGVVDSAAIDGCAIRFFRYIVLPCRGRSRDSAA